MTQQFHFGVYIQRNPKHYFERIYAPTPVFIAALFIVAKLWKQLTSRWVDKKVVVHVYNRILLIQKKEWNLTTCNNMDGPTGYYTKWNKLEKNKYHII